MFAASQENLRSKGCILSLFRAFIGYKRNANAVNFILLHETYISFFMKHPLAQFTHCPKCGSDTFKPNNEKSNRCDDCGFVYYFNPSAATVALIFNKKGEILVCRRAKEPAKGTLDLPGGFVDMNETAEQGVIREVLEETGLIVNHTQYLFSLPNLYLYSEFEVHTLDLFFKCEIEDESTLLAEDDAQETFFLPTEQIVLTDFGLHSIRVGLAKFLKEI